jgi:hypothetical protein
MTVPAPAVAGTEGVTGVDSEALTDPGPVPDGAADGVAVGDQPPTSATSPTNETAIERCIWAYPLLSKQQAA